MDLSNLRVKELTEICKRLGIRSSGKKAELVERLTASSAFQQSAGSARANGANKRSAHAELPQSGSSKKLRGERQKTVDAIGRVFDKFRDADSMDSITDDGILAFCEELGIDAQDPVILVLSWFMEAAAMCEFTRSEFVRGFEKLGCQSMDELKATLPLLRRKLREPTEFAPIYSFTFGFAKDPTQKSLALDIAVGLWELLLPQYFPLLPHWLAFVKANCRNSISKDVWMQVLEFGTQIKPDLSNFDENGAWPVLLDDFVTHLQDEFKARGVAAVLAEHGRSEPAAMAVDS
ncbi:hypothetical protein PybrP1_002077 [[Pythium] brassicae (nom. inval.)]|nr:hypothetical protein PybrP1_002077 [[Pythium] brassicae (nom. inval.)]